MKLLIISDVHGSIEALQNLAQKETGADALLCAGDLTHFGGKKQARPLVELLRSFNIPVLTVHGNCDRSSVADLFAEEGISAHGQVTSFEGVPVAGFGGSLPAPIPTPSTYKEEEAAGILENLGDGFSGSPWIFLVHQPPADSEADIITSGKHVGSKSVADYIMRFRPSLVCTGHIHESFSVSTFGDSLVVNPGSLKEGRYATAEIAGTRVSAELKRL